MCTVVNIVTLPKMPVMVINAQYFNLMKEKTVVFNITDVRVYLNMNIEIWCEYTICYKGNAFIILSVLFMCVCV